MVTSAYDSKVTAGKNTSLNASRDKEWQPCQICFTVRTHLVETCDCARPKRAWAGPIWDNTYDNTIIHVYSCLKRAPLSHDCVMSKRCVTGDTSRMSRERCDDNAPKSKTLFSSALSFKRHARDNASSLRVKFTTRRLMLRCRLTICTT